MRGHWPGHVDCRRLGLGVQGADQGVLGHLPVLVGFLLGGQAVADLPAGADLLGRVPVRLPERVLPGLPVPERELEEPLADTEGRRRPTVQGRPGDLLDVLMGMDNWGRGC